MFSSDVIPSGARDLQWNVVPTVVPEDSSPRKLRRLGMTIKLTDYLPCVALRLTSSLDVGSDSPLHDRTMPMALFLVPVAAYLVLYAPGHYLLRQPASGHRSGSRLFREVLLSACCTSWIGFALAELSLYSLPAVLGCLAIVSVVAAWVNRGRASWSYDATDLAGLAVAASAWVFLSPALDTRIFGSDSAGYLAAGVHLSRHGSLIFHDPTLLRLPADLKRELFPSVSTIPGAPPYLRLLGSMVLRSLDSDEVLPAFHHLVAVWIAIFHGIGGSAAAQSAITLFGGLSLWAMVAFAAATRSRPVAGIVFMLLSLSAVQNWYSRFLMPEIPAQFFLWGGLSCVAVWGTTQRRADAVLAGIAFGIAGLMRIENAVFLLIALPVGLAFAKGTLRTQRLLLFACAAAVWAHAVGHLLYFRTHYVGILLSLFPETVALFTGAPGLRRAALVACMAALLVWQYRRGFSAFRSMAWFGALATIVSLWGEWQHDWSGLALVAGYMGAPTVIAGAVGLLLWMKQSDHVEPASRVFCALAALAFVQFLVAPHVTPVPIWAIRRAATIVVPALCLGVAFLCQTVARRWHWSAAAVIFCVAIAGQVRPFTLFRSGPYFENGLRNVEAVAALLPPNACLLIDTPVTPWGFGPSLWAEHDLPPYFLSRYNGPRIARVLKALDGMPVYWLGESRVPPPRLPGVEVIRIGTHRFTLLTPTLDPKTAPGMRNKWILTVAVYAMHTRQREAVH